MHVDAVLQTKPHSHTAKRSLVGLPTRACRSQYVSSRLLLLVEHRGKMQGGQLSEVDISSNDGGPEDHPIDVPFLESKSFPLTMEQEQ